jgi:hypothetical protein
VRAAASAPETPPANYVGFSFTLSPDVNSVLLKRPSALIPLAMSVAALSLVVGHIAFVGVGREADEGTAAHIWQLLMAGQIPIIAFFALKWLPRTPGPALFVLVLQGVACLAAAAPVFLLGL